VLRKECRKRSSSLSECCTCGESEGRRVATGQNAVPEERVKEEE
jgi:hypothetical protein